MNKKRYTIIYVLIGMVGLLVAGRLISLQIIQGEDYYMRSAQRFTRTTSVAAPRGDILDRFGRPLVTSRQSFTIQIQRFGQTDSELNSLINNLVRLIESEGGTVNETLPISNHPFFFTFNEDEGQPQAAEKQWKTKNKFDPAFSADDVIASLKKQYRVSEDYTVNEQRKIVGVRYEMSRRGFSSSVSFTIANDVTEGCVVRLRERNIDFPNVNIVLEPTRQFMQGETLAHILGQVGTLYPEEYETLKDKGYKLNDQIGKQGIEKYLEDELRGVDGKGTVEQSADGRTLNIVNTQAPVPGNNVILTIDLELQRVAEATLRDTIAQVRANGEGSPDGDGADARCGAVAVLDVQNGEVLAIASYPGFDPEKFNALYTELEQDQDKPIFNRAIAGTYEPGSTFKMVSAIAALEEGIITQGETVECTGVYKHYAYAGFQPRCWVWNERRGVHGHVNVTSAIEVSCNHFFYDVGRRLGIERLNQYSRKFGFGTPSGIELTGEERAGRLAGPDDREEFKSERWYYGDTLQAAIGQSQNLFTPLQMANYIATLVNGGTHYSAHLIKAVRTYGDGAPVRDTEPAVLDKLEINPANHKAVMDGMRNVTEQGTASSVFKDYHIPVGGKTGTAQVSRGSDNGIFVAFAPFDNPKIAVAAVVEHGVHGNTVAGIALDIFEAYFSSPADPDEISTAAQLLR